MPPDLGNILDNSAKIIPRYMEIIASISHEIIDAGPANFAPIAGRKKIPVPSIEFIVIKRRTGNVKVFLSSAAIDESRRLEYKKYH